MLLYISFNIVCEGGSWPEASAVLGGHVVEKFGNTPPTPRF